MIKNTLIVSLNFLLLYSCGNKATNSSSGKAPTDTVNYANSGPTVCNPTSSTFDAKIDVDPYYANFEEALSKPFKTSIKPPSMAINYDNKFQQNLKIVGGDSLPDNSNSYCHSSHTDAGTFVSKNTVLIVTLSTSTTPRGRICTGVLVTADLVLTAAHCFNDFYDYSVNPPKLLAKYNTSSTSAMNTYVILADTVNVDAISGAAPNTSTVSCWQRHPRYRSQYTAPSDTIGDVSQNLNDIAWIKLATPFTLGGYASAAPLLSDVSKIGATEEKLLAGYGHTSESSLGADGKKRCISTSADSAYSSRGDIIPSGAINTYNAEAERVLGIKNAFNNYMTVIGPINNYSGSYTSRGTCYGDSGGPVYMYKSGNWVLAALTQGSDSLLTPHPTTQFGGQTSVLNPIFSNHPASCDDGYGTYTTVGNYLNWIQASSGETLATVAQ